MIVLTRAQVRDLDRIAVERFGIPGVVLMENAGRGATDVLLRVIAPPVDRPVLVVAGRGNNGGDGFVIARHLALRGWSPIVAILGHSADFRGSGEAAANFAILEKMGLTLLEIESPEALASRVSQHGAVVDAILGTGLSGEVRGRAAGVIELLNNSSVPVFAVDIPSGLDCDTGRPLGVAIRAAATATFGAMKAGLQAEGAAAYTGPVEVVDIGAPAVWE
jgi:NAD(P)H-hydrate epimerase